MCVKTINLDLGPGSLQTSSGSPFEVSIDTWKKVNDYLINITQTDAQETANIVKDIPSFATVKAIADKWKPTILPNIVQLAEGTYNYGENTVGGKFPEVKKLVGNGQSPIPAESLTKFREIMTEILTETQSNAILATGIVGDLAILDNTIPILNKEAAEYISESMGMPNPQNLAAVEAIAATLSQLASLLSAVGTPPITDIERIRGRWEAITADLKDFQATVSAEISANSPFIISLNLDSAIKAWSNLGTEARQFIKNIQNI